MNQDNNTNNTTNETDEEKQYNAIMKSSKKLYAYLNVLTCVLFILFCLTFQTLTIAIPILIAAITTYFVSDAIHNCMNGFALIVKNSKEKVIIDVKKQ